MRLLIVDDEPLALQRLQRLLGELGEKSVTPTSSAKEALELLATNDFDALITDIQMPGLSGLDLAYDVRAIHPSLPIIFQTAYGEHALKSYDIGAIDYLLKPYDISRLQRTLTKIAQLIHAPPSLKLMSKNGDTFYLLDPKDIYYVKADLAEVMIRDKERFSYYKSKISQLSSRLEAYGFFQIHRSLLINLNKIDTITLGEQSRLIFSFHGIKERLESSKEGAKQFRQAYPKSMIEE